MSVADLGPWTVPVGAKVTLMVQLAPPARDWPIGGQVFVCVNSPGFEPMMVIPVPFMVTAVVPLLVIVTGFGALLVLRF